MLSVENIQRKKNSIKAAVTFFLAPDNNNNMGNNNNNNNNNNKKNNNYYKNILCFVLVSLIEYDECECEQTLLYYLYFMRELFQIHSYLFTTRIYKYRIKNCIQKKPKETFSREYFREIFLIRTQKRNEIVSSSCNQSTDKGLIGDI
ncbi:hypothetical protein DERP_011261 [Dermatophagoides pteronyssinus]|uniref:Uncharacterized protein n=1 Tax=Dermatophagoides pteronyssinus TaxID=6956 RepID=A0ABQ8JCR4_DERPT|nr:hypothetical protein DERP_011261 [Dermatophagoides pteronyssinus]